MNLPKLIITGSLALLSLIPANAQILINEVMQSNVYSIMDDLNDFPDSWIELYNSGDQPVNLYGYRLNVKDKFKSAYSLPNLTVEPGAVALIYCDKVGEGLHADFRVDSGKGDIYLYDSEGNVVDHITLKKQPSPEVAYGRESDGSDVWGYELTPTPGKRNAGGLSGTVLGNVTFSTPGGVWADEKDMQIALSLPANAPSGARIIYTTTGAEPTLDNATVYSEPISVTESTVIRAKAVADGCISIPSDVQSYIFLGREIKLPVISIAVNEEYFYDDLIGILAEGYGGWMSENFRNDWRRPINIEYFEGEGSEAALNQLCETRVQGGLSRNNNLKSLAVYANKRFGTKNFAHPLWPADKPELTSCKSFILRNGGNDFDGCYMRDGLIQRVIGRNVDELDWQAYSPVIVFVNGQYHAMMALRERSNENYVEANYGGLEDIDMFENWDELKAGNQEASVEFKEFLYNDVHSYDEWNEYINLENFANLIAINYWVYNSDFPMNNVVFWRRTDGVDGRWQWILKDCDYGLGIWNQMDFVYSDYDKFLHSNVGPSVGFDLYQRLLGTQFYSQFVNRLIVYMGDFMNARTFHQYMDEILDSAKDEMAISHSKWSAWHTDFNQNLEFMSQWIDTRDAYMPTLMHETWDLGSPVNVKVNLDVADSQLKDIKFSYNGIGLTKGTFDGCDYMGRTIELSANSDSVVGWEVTVGNENSTIKQPILTLTLDSTADVTINAIIKSSGINGTEFNGTPISMIHGKIFADGRIEVFDLVGRKVADGIDSVMLPSKGTYIVRTEGHTAKFIW